MAKLSKRPALRKRPRRTPNPRGASRRVARRRISALRVLERLTSGLSVAHIARVEKLAVRRALQIIAAMLEGREIDPPAGFVQLQVARLSAAMIVSHTMTMEGDLQAEDRTIRLTRKLDRYRGFAQAPALPEPHRRLAGAAGKQGVHVREEEADAKFCASQPLGIARNREGISETSLPPK
jgi:hypothetical protein